VARPRFIDRSIARFLREPPSVLHTASVIVTVTLVVALAGGALMSVLDRDEYPNIWLGMWWALQTVTTVGYGDVTPENLSGRIVAVFVMLEGIAFIAILTSAVTSTFVTRALRERERAQAQDEEGHEDRVDARLDDVIARLDRLEQMLSRQENTRRGP
jgi:voltage-gated potassium channel